MPELDLYGLPNENGPERQVPVTDEGTQRVNPPAKAASARNDSPFLAELYTNDQASGKPEAVLVPGAEENIRPISVRSVNFIAG
ncbi:hypothetical protein [Streptomyces chattanoogensis]|uniref:Uncharacterized protein n=1 Tax=Streptomyces chattanoogensis TaxID=66876 RepID=A0A0N0GVX1_9ACTN|nr:hypothetical protein [Streptomyces chattanoogensis]AJT64875.1 hypothetical protein T261_3205 [Streptomyces lydicus]KPC59320.1 hypothetical protein ADL29_35225 [Streptomyces chattanoogensis]